jgi:uncharacterized protein
VLRLLEGLSGPRKGLIGPWGHGFPHYAAPGPAIGFLQESLRWWDHWLKGRDDGVMDEPMLRVWMQASTAPSGQVTDRPGRWVAEDTWPSPRLDPQRWRMDADGMLRDAAGASRVDPEAAAAHGADTGGRLRIRGSQLCGVDAGAWCAEGQPSDMPPDQRAAEGQSLCFTSAPLPGRLEILGHPVVELRFAADRPLALVAARLDDVSPDGASSLVAQQVFNVTHGDGHERPEALEPRREYTVEVRLDAVAYAFPAGHRLRVAVSPTYWPLAWPSPEPVELTLAGGECRLELPARPPRPDDETLPAFEEPLVPPGLGEQTIGGGPGDRSYVRDLAEGSVSWTYRYVDGGNVILPNGWESEEWNIVTYDVTEGDPLSAAVHVRVETVLRRGDQGRFHIVTLGQMSCDASSFFVENEIHVREGEEDAEREVFGRTWRRRTPRDFV